MNAQRGRHWRFEQDAEGIVWLWADRAEASTNVLSSEVLTELDAHLSSIASHRPAGLVVLSAKNSGFIAGADIKEFTRIADATAGYRLIRAGQSVLERLHRLDCPTVAAVHGFALGGGLELALACRYRIAVADDRLALGLPEVRLGIHPGFGGTVRSVQLIGVLPAMQLMLTGKSVRATQALKLGLVDRLVEASALHSAARELIQHPPAPRRAPVAQRLLGSPLARPWVCRTLLKQVAAQAPRAHYPAPYAIIELWRRCAARGAAAYEAEAQSIAHLFTTPSARNLIRIFLLQDRLKALAPKSALPLERVHVVGAGVMGGDIAAWAALRGMQVTVQDRTATLIEAALRRAAAVFSGRLRDPTQVAAACGRLSADLDGNGVTQADVIIEAIVENLEAKRALLQALEPRLKPAAVLATNTSSFMIEALAAGLERPERLIGLHFFNPVARMPLVEIVQGPAGDAATLATATAFTRKLDKLPLPCRSAPGFLVNRVLMPYLHEAMRAAAEGVPLALIDRVAEDFGMPMGPIELADVIGLDVAGQVGTSIAQALGWPTTDLGVLRERVETGRFGRKTGQGFYAWRGGKAVKPRPRGTAPPDLADRLVLILVNECVACLRERIAADADLIDAALVFGAGFAPFRGGPLHYAQARGVQAVTARLQALAARHGPRFEPDRGWPLLEANGQAQTSANAAAACSPPQNS